MKKLLLFLLLFIGLKSIGQTTGYLRFDTVRIFKQNGTCELYLINSTKDSLGVLTNVGGGLTRFLKSRMLNDSVLVVGRDTLTIVGNLDRIQAANGLTKSGNTILFGGVLDQATNLYFNGFDVKFLNGTSGTNIHHNFTGTGSVHLALDPLGNATKVGIGTSSPTVKFDANGVGLFRDPTTGFEFSGWPTSYNTSFNHNVLGVFGDEPSIDILIDSGSQFQIGGLTFRTLKDLAPKLPTSRFGFGAGAKIEYNAFLNGPAWTSTMEFYLGDRDNNTIHVFAISGEGTHFFGNRKVFTAESKESLMFGTAIRGVNSAAISGLADTTYFAGDAGSKPLYVFNMPSTSIDTTNFKPMVINPTTGQWFRSFWPSTGGGGGGGSVTDFIFTDGSGFDGTVATSTSTPTLSLTTSLTAGSVPIIGASGALTEDNSNFFFDNTNNRLGLGTNVPTHPLTLQQTNAFLGVSLYKTADQTTNYGRGIIRMRSSGSTPIQEYDIQSGGSVSGGYHSFQVAGVEKLTVDAAQATFSGHFFFSPDNTYDIGRLSATAFRPRNLYMAGSGQFGAPANTTIARTVHVVTQDAVTNTITNVGRFAHITSGTAAAGSGVGLEMESENASGTQIITGSITNPYTTATNATEAADFAFNLITAGSIAEKFRITSTGLVTFGGITNSFPALKRSSTSLQVRLADDSGDGGFITGSLTVNAEANVSVSISSAATLTLGAHVAYVFSGTTTTWTLPAVGAATGRTYLIKNRGSGNITLNTSGGGNDIYENAAINTLAITPGTAVRLISDGTFFLVM